MNCLTTSLKLVFAMGIAAGKTTVYGLKHHHHFQYYCSHMLLLNKNAAKRFDKNALKKIGFSTIISSCIFKQFVLDDA